MKKRYSENEIDWSLIPFSDQFDSEIAETIGCSKSLVYRVRKKLNIKPPNKLKIDWSNVDFVTKTTKEISKYLGCSVSTVNRQRKMKGIPSPYLSRSGIDWNKVDFDKKNDAEISKELGVNRSSVQEKRKKLDFNKISVLAEKEKSFCHVCLSPMNKFTKTGSRKKYCSRKCIVRHAAVKRDHEITNRNLSLCMAVINQAIYELENG